ncbi:MAG: hypothetical protein PHS98_04995 [Bacilli bacterium]|nr:hypothetical protein [Bacilli bacterium]
MNYKYSEHEYAELIYNNGFQSKYIPTELKLLVLYFRDELGMKPKEREYSLYKFCNKYIPDFKKEDYYKSINTALRIGTNKQQKLVTISKVDIYQSELDYINSLEINQEYKKVMFTFLVQLKLNKMVYKYKNNKDYNISYFQGGKIKYNMIKNMSNIPKTISLNDEVINTLSGLGLVTILHRGKINLDYIKNCIPEGKVAFEITDFENVGLYLDYYNGVKGVIKCEGCGNKIIKVNNNKQKYCGDCAKEIWEEQNRINNKERMRKIRQNNNSL